MKGWDEPQSANTNKEHEQSLPHIEARVVATIRHRYPLRLHSAWQATSKPPCRHNPRYQTGNDKRHGIVRGAHKAIVPKHEPRWVANNRHGATTVGRHHDGRSVNHAVTAIGYDFTHDDQHHQGCGKVVEIHGNEERHDRQCPQHALSASRFQ